MDVSIRFDAETASVRFTGSHETVGSVFMSTITFAVWIACMGESSTTNTTVFILYMRTSVYGWDRKSYSIHTWCTCTNNVV